MNKLINELMTEERNEYSRKKKLKMPNPYKMEADSLWYKTGKINAGPSTALSLSRVQVVRTAADKTETKTNQSQMTPPTVYA